MNYSYEQRKIAVQYCIEHGGSIKQTVTALKYPSSKQLYKWMLEDAPDIAICKSEYTAEQRRIAVQYYLEHDRSVEATIKALGYPSDSQMRKSSYPFRSWGTISLVQLDRYNATSRVNTLNV